MGKGHKRSRENVICGRKFCRDCGIWRLACFFPLTSKVSQDGTPILQSRCDTCNRTYWREQRRRNVERRRATQREWYRIERRLAGVKPRYPDEHGHRSWVTGEVSYPLEPYKPIADPWGSRRDQVNATAFIEWYDEWIKRNEGIARGMFEDTQIEQPRATVEDICALSGFSAKIISNARYSGTISYAKAEAFLVNAGHPEPWVILEEADSGDRQPQAA